MCHPEACAFRREGSSLFGDLCGMTNGWLSQMTTIRYIVNDVAASLAFYTKHLGFEELENFGIPFASVKRGDTILWLALAPRVLRPGRCRMESSRSPAAGIGARVPLGAE